MAKPRKSAIKVAKEITTKPECAASVVLVPTEQVHMERWFFVSEVICKVALVYEFVAVHEIYATSLPSLDQPALKRLWLAVGTLATGKVRKATEAAVVIPVVCAQQFKTNKGPIMFIGINTPVPRKWVAVNIIFLGYNIANFPQLGLPPGT